jgi:hypothetical protein
VTKDWAVYPAMVPDGKGGWKYADPAWVNHLTNLAMKNRKSQKPLAYRQEIVSRFRPRYVLARCRLSRYILAP